MSLSLLPFNTALIVDDSLVDNLIHKKLLSKMNPSCRVHAFTESVKAVNYLEELLQKNEPWPDIIFVDIRMLEMDGFEFLERVQNISSERYRSHQHIYMLSASLDPKDQDKVNVHPVIKKLLNKPLTPRILEMELEL